MVADATRRAVLMSLDERKEHHQRRAEYVRSHTHERWACNFISNLDQATQHRMELNFVQVKWSRSVRCLSHLISQR